MIKHLILQFIQEKITFFYCQKDFQEETTKKSIIINVFLLYYTLLLKI